MPISDNVQGIIMLISGIFMAVGTLAVPSTVPDHDVIAAIFWILGIIGMVTKEKLGAAITGTSQTPSIPSSVPAPPGPAVVNQTLTPDG